MRAIRITSGALTLTVGSLTLFPAALYGYGVARIPTDASAAPPVKHVPGRMREAMT